MAPFVFTKNDFLETTKLFVEKKLSRTVKTKKRFQETTLITATINVYKSKVKVYLRTRLFSTEKLLLYQKCAFCWCGFSCFE